MTGKQLVPDDPEYRRAFQPRTRSTAERIGDSLEGYFTGTHKGRFWPELVASAASAFLVCWLIVAAIMAVNPHFGFMGPYRPLLPEWITKDGGTDIAFLKSAGRWCLIVFWHWHIFLWFYIPWMIWRTFTLAQVAVPQYFKERAARNAADAKEREQVRRNYEAGIAQQLSAAEAAKRAKRQEEANRLEAEQRERKAQIEHFRAYAQKRAEVREDVQRRVLAAVARARLDALVKGDPDPTETACQRVRGAMQRENPKPPDWGLLRDREISDPTIKSLIGDGKWLPEAPPYPAGFSTGLLN